MLRNLINWFHLLMIFGYLIMQSANNPLAMKSLKQIPVRSVRAHRIVGNKGITNNREGGWEVIVDNGMGEKLSMVSMEPKISYLLNSILSANGDKSNFIGKLIDDDYCVIIFN